MRYVSQALEVFHQDGAKALGKKSYRFAKRRGSLVVRKIKHKVRWRQATPSVHDVISIDPASVEYVLAPRFQEDLPSRFTYIRNGNWDINESETALVYAGKYEASFDQRLVVPYEEYTLYQSFIEHFEEGLPWEETELYQWALNNQEALSKRVDTQYKGIEAINARFEYFDELYEQIKREGYKNQEELGKNSAYDEVTIDIGRDGRFILDDGRHRLSIAKVLGLDSIPVRIFVRHLEWQQIRSDVAKGNTTVDTNPSEIVCHPDIKNLDLGD